MPEGLPGDQPQVCACPGCDEVVVQRDPGSIRFYHSDECRRKARRLRRARRAVDTADLPAVEATPGHPAADLAPAAELAAAKAAPPAELAAAELPGTAELSGSAAGHDAVSAPEDHDGTDAAEDSGDSEFWKPGNGEADGFWDADKDSPRKGARSPGRHRPPASQPSRLMRSHTAAIAFTLAASAVGLGLILSQPGPRHPLASEAQLPPTGPVRTQPASSSSSSPVGPAQTRHAPSHAAGGTSPAPRPPVAARSPAPSPTPSASRKPTPQVTRGLISFENGTDGWSAFWGSISVSRTTQVAYSGSHSLLITTRSTYSAVGVDNGSVAHLRPGDKVTFHIYSYGQNASVEPFVQESDYSEDVAEGVPVPSQRGWFTLTWVVPSVPSVHAIGMQVTNHGSGPLTLAIDAMTWPGS